MTPKGGTSKTTTVLNLAAALEAIGCTVALVDLDPQENLLSFQGCLQSRYWLKELPAWRKSKADFILIDSPPRPDNRVKEAIERSAVVLVPFQANRFSMEASLRMRRELSTKNSPQLKALWTHYSAAYRPEKADILAGFGNALCRVIVPKSTHIEKACNEAVSVLQYAPDSPGAKAYKKLAVEVLEWREDESI